MTTSRPQTLAELAPIHRYGHYGERLHNAVRAEREQRTREQRERQELERATQQARADLTGSIRALRNDLNIPARAVAKEIGCSVEEYIDLEDGGRYLERLAGLAADWLLDLAQKRYGARHLKENRG